MRKSLRAHLLTPFSLRWGLRYSPARAIFILLGCVGAAFLLLHFIPPMIALSILLTSGVLFSQFTWTQYLSTAKWFYHLRCWFASIDTSINDFMQTKSKQAWWKGQLIKGLKLIYRLGYIITFTLYIGFITSPLLFANALISVLMSVTMPGVSFSALALLMTSGYLPLVISSIAVGILLGCTILAIWRHCHLIDHLNPLTVSHSGNDYSKCDCLLAAGDEYRWLNNSDRSADRFGEYKWLSKPLSLVTVWISRLFGNNLRESFSTKVYKGDTILSALCPGHNLHPAWS